MIIYVHGFGGSGDGSKAKAFREYFKTQGKKFIAPSLSYVPELAIKTLEELIESYDEEVCLIGSSLGGYYSIYLADKYKLKAVLLNPSVNPRSTLQRSLGQAPCFYDNSNFSWTQKHLDMLNSFEVKDVETKLYLLLTQKGDELLDYTEATDKLDGAQMIVEDGGNHSFKGIEMHFKTVEEFFKI